MVTRAGPVDDAVGLGVGVGWPCCPDPLQPASQAARTRRTPNRRICRTVASRTRLNIGDVTVVDRWTQFPDGPVNMPVDPTMMAVAHKAALGIRLERRTPTGDPGCSCLPPGPVKTPVTVKWQPRVVFGGTGVNPTPVGNDANDMETAAVAQVAKANNTPFLAFRALSDGLGDRLHLPGFPFQFFFYYQLAADNAAKVTLAFLRAWAHH